MKVNFRSEIGSYLMTKGAQRERENLRFLCDAVAIICVFFVKRISESNVIDKQYQILPESFQLILQTTH